MSEYSLLSPAQQGPFLEQLYGLLGHQVRSYHKHHHMGVNSSVPTELARELMASVTYTLGLAGGVQPGQNVEQALLVGQTQLEKLVLQAQALLKLVNDTAPSWQTECRWDALRCIERYLAAYDLLHLAHRVPDAMYYPVPVAPEGLEGIEYCLFYLNEMWCENQIMAAAEDWGTEALWDRLAGDICCTTMNQCEQLLINAIGKAMVSPEPDTLLLQEWERVKVYEILRNTPPEQRKRRLYQTAKFVSDWLKLTDAAAEYAMAAAGQLSPRLEGPMSMEAMEAIFL